MSDKINKPYTFTKLEKKVIKNNFKSYTDWENPVFGTIKNNIRDHLRTEQKNRCCYCKKELGYDIKEVDIEHIIPKASYEKFTFESLNLALSCPSCNTIKGDKEVLSSSILNYPRSSNKLLINHAHLDEYSKNIIIHEECIFEGISKKGCRTIEICELFRLKIVEQKAKKKLSKRSSENKLLETFNKGSKEEKILILKEVIKSIK